MLKIEKRSTRVLLTITIVLLIIIAGIVLIYGVGLNSPLTKNLFFTMAFGAPPDTLDLMISGVVTLLPLAIVFMIFRGIYKLAKAIYQAYS